MTRMRSSSVALLLAAISLASFGCDNFYVVKGTVIRALFDSGKAEIEGSVASSKADRLSGVVVVVYHSGGQGRLPQTISHVTSDATGQYRLVFHGPWRLSRAFFAEFSRTGYETKRVYFTQKSTDPTVEIKPCNKEEKLQCWMVDVVLSPSSAPSP